MSVLEVTRTTLADGAVETRWRCPDSPQCTRGTITAPAGHIALFELLERIHQNAEHKPHTRRRR